VKISVDPGVGLILVLVASFLQSAAAIAAYFLSSGVAKPTQQAPQYADYGSQPGYGQTQFAGQPTPVVPEQETPGAGTTYQPPYPSQ